MKLSLKRAWPFPTVWDNTSMCAFDIEKLWAYWTIIWVLPWPRSSSLQSSKKTCWLYKQQVVWEWGYTSSKWSGNEVIQAASDLGMRLYKQQMVWEWGYQAASGLGMRLKHSRTNKFEHTVGHLELVAMLDSLVHGSNSVIIPTHGQPLHHWHQLLIPTSMVP